MERVIEGTGLSVLTDITGVRVDFVENLLFVLSKLLLYVDNREKLLECSLCKGNVEITDLVLRQDD